MQDVRNLFWARLKCQENTVNTRFLSENDSYENSTLKFPITANRILRSSWIFHISIIFFAFYFFGCFIVSAINSEKYFNFIFFCEFCFLLWVCDWNAFIRIWFNRFYLMIHFNSINRQLPEDVCLCTTPVLCSEHCISVYTISQTAKPFSQVCVHIYPNVNLIFFVTMFQRLPSTSPWWALIYIL